MISFKINLSHLLITLTILRFPSYNLILNLESGYYLQLITTLVDIIATIISFIIGKTTDWYSYY